RRQCVRISALVAGEDDPFVAEGVLVLLGCQAGAFAVKLEQVAEVRQLLVEATRGQALEDDRAAAGRDKVGRGLESDDRRAEREQAVFVRLWQLGATEDGIQEAHRDFKTIGRGRPPAPAGAAGGARGTD